MSDDEKDLKDDGQKNVEKKEESKSHEKEFRDIDDLDAVYNVPVRLSAVLGHSSMQVSQLLKLGRGAVIELDRRVGEPIDIYVNERLIARGEVVVTEDRLGITMTEIMKSEKNRGS